MKLLNIYLYDLKNSGHFEFVHSVVEFARQCEGVNRHLEKWFAPFQAAVDEEDRLMQISLKNVISEKLSKLDGERDGLVSAICGATNAMLKSIDNEIFGAAQEVMNELVSLKVDIQDNYLNQTGQIDTLTAVLLGAQRSNVERLGLLALVQRLHDVNQLMHSLMNQRDKEQFDRMNDTLAKARLVTDAAYADFAFAIEGYTFINQDALAEDDEGFTQLVNDMNARIEYFRRYVLKVNSLPEVEMPGAGGSTGGTGSGSGSGETDSPGAGSPSNPGAGGSGGGDNGGDNSGSTGGGTTEGGGSSSEGGPLYTIAWYDKSTPIQWYELPAGAAVPEAPEPPAGHRWAQTFTVMPARDVDIVAVALQ